MSEETGGGGHKWSTEDSVENYREHGSQQALDMLMVGFRQRGIGKVHWEDIKMEHVGNYKL